MDGIPAAERPRGTTSIRAEWRGMRPALKRHDKGWVPNVSTVVPHLHRWGIQTVSPTRRATPIRRVSLSMKVPTPLFGTQLSQTPDSGRGVALKHARRCWLSTGTMVATAEEHWISSQFLCLWALEGRTRFRSSQARTSSSSSCLFVGWRRMSLTKLILAAREDRNAGSARSAAVRSPRPPYRTGSLACDQLLPSKRMFYNASVVERVITSYSAWTSGWWWHGADRRVNRRRGRENAFFSRKRPGCPSSKMMRSFIHLYSDSFYTIQHLVASARIGDPRSSILVSSVTLISGSSSLKLLTTRENFSAARPTLIISVLFGLTMRPIRLSPVMHLCTSLRTDSGEPPIVASSRYQTFCSESTPFAIWSTASANRRGPIGSPCWTPVDEVIEWPEAMTDDGLLW